jgi:hypothetical protein
LELPGLGGVHQVETVVFLVVVLVVEFRVGLGVVAEVLVATADQLPVAFASKGEVGSATQPAHSYAQQTNQVRKVRKEDSIGESRRRMDVAFSIHPEG